MREFSLRRFLIVLFLLLLIDVPVIMVINHSMYKSLFQSINGGSSPSLSRVAPFAVFAYILMALSITLFTNDWKSGALLGLVIYGIYNCTNSATITNYTSKEAIIDMTWGTILFGLVSHISLYFSPSSLHSL